jgi:hypothetical protein
MASKSRIDDNDNRMRVAKFWHDVDPDGKEFVASDSRYMTVVERSRIMGYYDDYVRKPLELLFEALTPAFRGGRMVNAFDWNTQLPQNYHHFAGLPHSFSPKDMSLQLAPPTIEGESQFFDEEMYGKHLIGNAYSVPVVASLLKPLQKIFVCGPKYKGIEYQYYWVSSYNDKFNAQETD